MMIHNKDLIYEQKDLCWNRVTEWTDVISSLLYTCTDCSAREDAYLKWGSALDLNTNVSTIPVPAGLLEIMPEFSGVN